jgi:hypothetical protein
VATDPSPLLRPDWVLPVARAVNTFATSLPPGGASAGCNRTTLAPVFQHGPGTSGHRYVVLHAFVGVGVRASAPCASIYLHPGALLGRAS